MTETERFERAMDLFQRACDLPAEERSGFLSQACGADARLRDEVESLLQHDKGESKAIQAADAGGVAKALAESVASGPSESLPERIARYRVIRLIGRGGMGVVYEAEQDHPRRRVALKVIRQGVLSSSLLRRFRFEADVLGRLQHPGIAQIHEAGEFDTEAGRQPYFAMEFIDGVELRAYTQEHHLDTRARLELVARICDAVQHAHQKGIVHRDLKPDNVLVEEQPAPMSVAPHDEFATLGQPKVLDFGVARATDRDVQLTTMQTSVGNLIGTVPYMSPEQVVGDAHLVDTRSDIYALGVILYELLAGRPPFDVRQKPIPEAARIIREEEPTHLSTVDAGFRGDIDTIVCKALEKDRERRYSSAVELAADIRRHLASEPILAHPPSTFYQLRKFARRNRGLVAGLGLAALMLIAGTITSLTLAFRAGRGEQRALRSEDAARRASYRAHLEAAESMSDTDPVQALSQLESAPPEHRGWEWRHLAARHNSALASYSGETDAAGGYTLARRPDGSLITAMPREGAIELIDLESGEVRGVFSDTHALSAPRLSADGSHLAAVTQPEKKLVVWDVSTGQRLSQFPTSFIVVRQIRFSRDGSILALPSDAGAVILVETSTGRVMTELPLKGADPRWDDRVTFDSEGKRIALVTHHTGGVFDLTVDSVDSNRLAARTVADGCYSLAFSPDGTLIAVGQHERKVMLLDASTLDEVEVLHGHRGGVSALAFSPDGAYLASSSQDGTTRIWDRSEARTVGVLSGGSARSLAFSGDGALLAAGFHSKAILWSWRTDARRVLRGHRSFVYQASFCPDLPQPGWVASSAWDNTVRLWDAITGEPLAVLPAHLPFKAMSFTPDGSRLLAHHRNAATGIEVWDPATGLGLTAPRTPQDATLFAALHQKKVGFGRRFAQIARGGGKTLISSKFLYSASSPDGALVAEAAADGVRVLDTKTYQQIIQLPKQPTKCLGAAFNPEGTRLATSHYGGGIIVWDLAGGDQLAKLFGHVDHVYALVFSPGGSRLVSGGNDGNIIFWDAETFERVALLRGHDSYVFSLAFSGDGTMLASASGDFTVRLWDSLPAQQRWQQLQQARRLRLEAKPLVERLLQELGDPQAVADHLRADDTLSEPFRRATLRVLLQRSSAGVPTDGAQP